MTDVRFLHCGTVLFPLTHSFRTTHICIPIFSSMGYTLLVLCFPIRWVLFLYVVAFLGMSILCLFCRLRRCCSAVLPVVKLVIGRLFLVVGFSFCFLFVLFFPFSRSFHFLAIFSVGHVHFPLRPSVSPALTRVCLALVHSPSHDFPFVLVSRLLDGYFRSFSSVDFHEFSRRSRMFPFNSPAVSSFLSVPVQGWG